MRIEEAFSIEQQLTTLFYFFRNVEPDFDVDSIAKNSGVLAYGVRQDASMYALSGRSEEVTAVPVEEVLTFSGKQVMEHFYHIDTLKERPRLYQKVDRFAGLKAINFGQRLYDQESKQYFWSNCIKLNTGTDNNTLNLALMPHWQASRLSFLKHYSNDLKPYLRRVVAYENLNPSELKILKLTANGYSSSEISERLFLSKATVDSYRKNMRKKDGLRFLKDWVQMAHYFGLMED